MTLFVYIFQKPSVELESRVQLKVLFIYSKTKNAYLGPKRNVSLKFLNISKYNRTVLVQSIPIAKDFGLVSQFFKKIFVANQTEC